MIKTLINGEKHVRFTNAEFIAKSAAVIPGTSVRNERRDSAPSTTIFTAADHTGSAWTIYESGAVFE